MAREFGRLDRQKEGTCRDRQQGVSGICTQDARGLGTWAPSLGSTAALRPLLEEPAAPQEVGVGLGLILKEKGPLASLA